ncbi:MAG: hypothetical protein R3F49_24500, partial [Planctomycetota bacterium]
GQPRAFARRNGDALVYYPALTSGAGSLQMDRSWEGGLTEAKYAARWWDPRNGAFMADPPVVFAVDSSGAAVPMAIPSSILNPTFMASEDYVLVVERVQ